MATKIAPPNVPFVEARYKSGKQTPALIVIHSTVTTSKKGAAQGVANMWHRSTSPKSSCHYVVDESITLQCVRDHAIAWHCGYNTNSVGIEMCDDPSRPVTRWAESAHKEVLIKTAKLTARLCLAYKIPTRFLTDAQLLKWGKTKKASDGGIVTHAQMGRVFKRSSHWDPGEWPKERFLAMVKGEAAKMTHEVSVKKRSASFKIAAMHVDSLPKMPNVLRLLEYGMGSHIIGLQEAYTKIEKEAIFKKFPQTIGIGTREAPADVSYSSPIVYGRKTFTIERGESELMYEGVPHISHTQRLTQVILNHKKTGIKVGAINLNSIRMSGSSLDVRLRMQASTKKAVEASARRLQKQGLPIVIMGAFNDFEHWFGPTFYEQKVNSVGRGIDQMVLINSPSFKWTVVDVSAINTPAKNDVMKVKVTLTEK